MFGDDVVQFFLVFLYLTSLNLDIGSLSLNSAKRLVYHHTAVWQGRTLSFLAGYEQYGCHGCCHAGADGGHVAGDELHGVINSESGSDTATIVVRVKEEDIKPKTVTEGACKDHSKKKSSSHSEQAAAHRHAVSTASADQKPQKVSVQQAAGGEGQAEKKRKSRRRYYHGKKSSSKSSSNS